MKLLDLPEGTHRKLDDFRRRVRLVKVVEGVLAAVFGLAISYLLVFVLDRVWDTAAIVRTTILLGGAVGLGLVFPLKCHRWVWGTRQMEQVARLVMHKFPRLGDQLLGIVELAHSESEQGRSKTLIQAAMNQVDESIRDREFTDAVPNPKHRRWAWIAGAPVVLAIVAFAVVPAAAQNAMVRWLMPWSDTERFTFTRLEQLPDELVVPLAEPFELQARLQDDSRWIPDAGKARYGSQDSVVADVKDGSYEFKLPPQQEAAELVVSVGDVSKAIEVKPTRRPELTDIMANVKLPDYLGYSQDVVADVRGGVISLVRGSLAKFEATASRKLESAALNGEPTSVDGASLETIPVAFTDSAKREFTWRDELGLTSREPFVLTINVRDDEAPSVFCNELSQNLILLETEVLTFDIRATDDFGVRQVGLEWSGVADRLKNPTPAKGEKVVSAGTAEARELSGRATFSARREGVKPQTLQLRAFVEDFKPGRERSYSAVYVVHVLSPEEHAIWMTEQLGKWVRAADGVYEREMQLHDRNLELRKLSGEEIDQPKNRKRIEQQAAAERANAARLNGLVGIGKQLVEQATRNDQFNVQTLETWAEMLQRLEKLSDDRMPSVADLLKQSASAPGRSGPPSQPKPAGPPKEAGPTAGNVRDSKTNPGKSPQSEPDDSKPIPSISDVESGNNEVKKPKGEEEDPPPTKGSSPLTLPTTSVLGGGPDPEKNEKKEACPASDKLEEAVEEQMDLLAEFEKIREELQGILDNLEGSTFVKRLKAASRRQIDVANNVNRVLKSSFGVSSEDVPDVDRKVASKIVERENAESENVYTIQEDLEAYFNRKQQGKYLTVLNEMRDTEVAIKLKEIGDSAVSNRNGELIVKAEFWADSLDRWAEQIVGPG